MIKFNKPVDFLESRLKQIPRYNTGNEKEALMLEDDEDFITIFNTLCPDSPVKPINEYEAIIFIFKAREISVSDIIEGVKECDNCNMVNNFQIDITKFYKFDRIVHEDGWEEECDIHSVKIPEKFKNIPIGVFEKIEDIMDEEEIDKLVVKDYHKIRELINDINLNIFNNVGEFKCIKCKEINSIHILPQSIISRTSLKGIFNEIFSLSFYSNNSIKEVEKLYPFERNIYLGLAKEKVENPANQLKSLF